MPPPCPLSLCCEEDSVIPCGPCDMPTTGALTLYYRLVTYDTTGSPTPAVCHDYETTVSLTFSGTVSPGGGTSGHWYSPCIPYEQGSTVFGGACGATVSTNGLKVYLYCFSVGLRIFAEYYLPDDCSAFLLSSQTFSGSWTTSVCDPFELRYQRFALGHGGLAEDFWIYRP